MTVSSEVKRKDYAGNGSTTNFATVFRFLQNSDVKVILTVDSTAVETVQVLDTDYTLVGAGLDAGGTVTMTVAPATGETLTVKRDVPLTQGTDYIENDEFPAESHEEALDKLTMITQQIQEELDRSLKLSEGQQSSGLIVPPPEDQKLLRWDANGDLENVTLLQLGSIVDAGDLPYNQGGIGAVNQTVESKLQEIVSVKDFGAKGDGSSPTEDTAAFKAAVAAVKDLPTGGLIEFPPGNYIISDNILINKDNVSLKGSGQGVTQLTFTDLTKDGITFKPDDFLNPVGIVIRNNHISDMQIQRVSDSTTGVAVTFTSCREFTLTNVTIVDWFGSVRITGCNFSAHYNLKTFAGRNMTTATAGSFGIRIDPLQRSDSSFFSGDTHLFSTCRISGNAVTTTIATALLLKAGEVAWFSNCYFGQFTANHIIVAPEANNINVNNAAFDTCYFDGVSSGSGMRAVFISNNGFTGGQLNNWSFSNCAFGQLESGFLITHDNVNGMRIEGKFFNIEKRTFQSTSDIVVDIDGTFTGVSTDAADPVIDIADAKLIKIAGTYKDTNSQTVIKLSGTITTVDIDTPTFNNTGTTIDASAATISKIVNFSGSFTPVLAFGGGVTGITYSTQLGKFAKNGDTVLISIFIALSSKGTDTGNAEFTGLPVTSIGQPQTLPVDLGGMTSGVGDTHLSSFIPGGNTVVRPRKQAAGTQVQLTDVDFSNSSFVTITGTYLS